MDKRILITGGAGFIGSHLADALLGAGFKVRVLDNLDAQVHGNIDGPPEYLSNEVEFIRGDIRDIDAVRTAMNNVSAVFHLASAVGVGQSMYEVQKYVSVNNLGTATVMQALIERPVEKLVVASSMSIYGEGLYKDSNGRMRTSQQRTIEQLKNSQWEIMDGDVLPLEPVATPENKEKEINSIYALTKYDQELMCLMVGRAYNINTTALRFFNVYGTRQSLSNPYTGVLAIFASRLLNNKAPLIYEDGLQRRDFVSVHDIVSACLLAMESENARDKAFNIGSGRSYTILQIADEIAKVMNKQDIVPQTTGKYRVGDIRHCFGDISLAQKTLNYHPRIKFQDGIEELSEWLNSQVTSDSLDRAVGELGSRGLIYGREH